MPRIFISYRRVDSQTVASRIYDRLVSSFGKQNIFMDVNVIPAGQNFRQAIADAVDKCDIMLVIIGGQWLSVQDANGNRRLDNVDDPVRFEIERALTSGRKRVIPVLVDNAPVPSVGNLPPGLQALVSNNAVTVRGNPDFHHDMNRLINQLRPSIRNRILLIAGSILATIVVTIIAISFINSAKNPALPTPTQAASTDVALNNVQPTESHQPTDTLTPTTTFLTQDMSSVEGAFIATSPTGETSLYIYRNGEPTPLNIPGKTPSYAAISPDRSQIAYIQPSLEGNKLFSRTLSQDLGLGTETTLLSSTNGLAIQPTQFAWSPDSKTILITLKTPTTTNVYQLDVAQHQLQQEPLIPDASSPAYSPDGSFIAVVGSEDHIIYTTSSESIQKRPISERDKDCSDPAFSLDRDSSLFYVCQMPSPSTLYAFTQLGSEPKPISLIVNLQPIYHPISPKPGYITFDDGNTIYDGQFENNFENNMVTTVKHLFSRDNISKSTTITWVQISKSP